MSAMASQITSLTIVYSRRRSKKPLKLRVTGLCEGNSPVTGEFPAQRASNAENVSIWWRHHEDNNDSHPEIFAEAGPYPGHRTDEYMNRGPKSNIYNR